MRNKILSLLVLLLTAASGAWAKTDPNAVYWTNEIWAGWAENVTTHTVGDITITCSGNAKAYESTTSAEPLALQAGANDAITFTSNGKPFASIAIQTEDVLNVAGWTYNSSEWSYEWSGEPTTSVTLSGCNINADAITFTFGTAEAPIEVTPGEAANTWTFAMPGSDVVLTPIYAKAAAFATTGTEPEVKTLLPAAAEGVIAGQDAAIVTPGQSAQGTVMYAVTTTAETAPALTAFSATVPTAKTYDDATTLYVWYYIQGQDTPDGQQATEENTFNDSEISATPLKVDILTNKFDLTLKPAPVKNMTVTVAGQAKTPTDEGKVTGVKMESEVKLKAADGYKFRKVEVKKGGADVKIESFSIQSSNNSVYSGSTFTCSIIDILPANATNQTFEWKINSGAPAGTTIQTVSEDTKTVRILAGAVSGSITIEATAKDGGGANNVTHIIVME